MSALEEAITEDDFEFSLPLCALCANYKGGTRCKAFSEIPMEIFTNEVSHFEPYDGDNGIQFEEIK